jgi:transcriptional regulator with XRE-family HTH domain
VRTGGGVAAARPRDGIITGYLLKLIRQSAGLSQEGLAEQLGVDRNTVQGWETGRRWSGGALLRRFAANLVASEPLADLYAHSLWALLERRGRLLEADPQLATSLAGAVEALLAEGDLSAQSRRELEQVHYGVRLLGKS